MCECACVCMQVCVPVCVCLCVLGDNELRSAPRRHIWGGWGHVVPGEDKPIAAEQSSQ